MPTFVGRSAELGLLRARHDEAAAGRPRTVVLEGTAGVGKSALVNAFSSSLDPASVLSASGDEAETFLPFGALMQLLGSRSATWPDPFAAGRHVLEILDQRHRDQPTVFVVDDAHLADTPSLTALTFALRRLQADRVLALVTRAGHRDRPGPVRSAAARRGAGRHDPAVRDGCGRGAGAGGVAGSSTALATQRGAAARAHGWQRPLPPGPAGRAVAQCPPRTRAAPGAAVLRAPRPGHPRRTVRRGAAPGPGRGDHARRHPAGGDRRSRGCRRGRRGGRGARPREPDHLPVRRRRLAPWLRTRRLRARPCTRTWVRGNARTCTRAPPG